MLSRHLAMRTIKDSQPEDPWLRMLDQTTDEMIAMQGRISLCAFFVFIGALFSPDADAATLRQERQCLALNLYWESRSESTRGMMAVGWVVLNRVQSRLFPGTPCEVVYDGGEQPPCQFSWWCDGKSDLPRNRRDWLRAQSIAAQLLTDPLPDPTSGALFYHATTIGVPWKRKRVRTTRIGGHIFYR